jgi:hypothetical protein
MEDGVWSIKYGVCVILSKKVKKAQISPKIGLCRKLFAIVCMELLNKILSIV